MKKHMDLKFYYKMRGKKALSEMISSVIIILIVVVSALVIWGVISNLVGKETEKTKCFDILDKVSINDEYTCHKIADEEIMFSISVENISIDKLLVSMQEEGGETRNFFIENIETTITNLKNSEHGESTKLPPKKGGATYYFDLVASGINPNTIKIAPFIEGMQCDESDSVDIDDCP